MNSTISNTLIVILIIVVIFVAMRKINKSHNMQNQKNVLQFFKSNDNLNKKLDLEKALQMISQYYNGVQKIQGKHLEYRYNRFTINEQLKKEVSVILQPILCKLNNIMDKNYKIDDYNLIVKEIDLAKTSILYTVDLFILDVEEHFRTKISAQIFYKIYSKIVHLNYIKLSNCNKLLDDCYIDDKPAITSETITFHKKNRKEMIVDIDTLKKNKKTKVAGQYKTNLEQSEYSNNKHSFPEFALKRHQWILPKNVIANKDKNAWPCKQTKHSWGKFGIMNNNPKDTKDCYGNNYATTKRNLVNRFTPDHGVYGRENTKNSDLFIPSSHQHTSWEHFEG